MKLEAKIGGAHWEGTRLIATVNFFRIDPTSPAPGCKHAAHKFATTQIDATELDLGQLAQKAQQRLQALVNSYVTFETLVSRINDGLCLATHDTDAVTDAAVVENAEPAGTAADESGAAPDKDSEEQPEQ